MSNFGAEYNGFAPLLYRLACIYRKQGKYEQAELLERRAFKIFEKYLEHADALFSSFPLFDLAWCMHNQGQTEQAEALFQRTLSVLEQRLRAGHHYILGTRKEYKVFLWSIGRVTAAEALVAIDEASL